MMIAENNPEPTSKYEKIIDAINEMIITMGLKNPDIFKNKITPLLAEFDAEFRN